MTPTFNKNGKPRKVGSGKTKGAGCFEKVSWIELREFVGEEVSIPVSRVWLRSIGISKIQNSGIPPKNKGSKMPLEATNEAIKTPDGEIRESTIADQSKTLKEDYEPPPLFATLDGIRKY